jgi:hypothetical protein
MSISHPKSLFLAALSVLLLIFSYNCSGDSGSIAGGGIDGTGAISGFSSIIVNGSEFDTSDAVIIIDGEEIGIGDEVVLDNLDVGRVVNVEGSPGDDDESFVANRVIYNNNIKGPVETINTIDTKTKEIIVLGQAVILNVNTSFKGTGFETIAFEDVVEVSGFFDHTGTIWATFIGKTGVLTPELDVEVTGSVSGLDTDKMTFQINNLVVKYLSADTSSLPDGLLTEGMWVEVDGSLDETGEVLLASTIKPGDGRDAENADQLEITGFVTGLVSTAEFIVGNQVVLIDPETEFVDGAQGDIDLGVKLEAEGNLADGILHAWEIEFWEPDQVEVEDVVTDIVSPEQFTVGNQVIQTDEHTVFEGIAPEEIELDTLIEVKGVPIDIEYSIIIADKISFDEEDEE